MASSGGDGLDALLAVDDGFVDEADWLLPGQMPDEPAWGADVFTSGAAHDAGVDAFEAATVAARQATAAQCALIATVLADAASCPDPWCGPDPTANPFWTDVRGRSAHIVQAERRDMAERAAVCDLAVRSHLSEVTVRVRGTTATTLQQRCPAVWAAFTSGDVDERNAAAAAQVAQTLPDDDPATWAEFDQAVARQAATLVPGRFRTRARVVRERVHPEGLDGPHARAREGRGVWVDPAADGMAFLQVCGPAADVEAAYGRVDRFARHLAGASDEQRTLAQLRADVALGLMMRGVTDETAGIPVGKPSVAVTVPALTLLGVGDEPALLDGYGPIDIDTARRLAGDASAWVRILTRPVTGTVMQMDRTVYRVPKALRRWLGARDRVCAFPGCGRAAVECDMDHVREWHDGGATDADNLHPLCRHHHRVKTETLWSVHAEPDAPAAAGSPPGGHACWVSPTGHTADDDPPPW